MALTDLTRISTSGIATGSTIDSPILRKDVSLRGSQVGVNSAIFDSSQNELNLKDDVRLTFGNLPDFSIAHNTSVTPPANQLTSNVNSDFEIIADNLELRSGTGDKSYLTAKVGSATTLFFNNTPRFKTTDHGAFVTGILTATSFSGPVVGNTNNSSGISTFYNLRVSNNLTVEGTTTTLDTNLIGVDRVEVGANSNTVTGIAVTQSGTADIVRLYDGTSQVVTVDDVGNVGIGTDIPTDILDIQTGSSDEVTKFKVKTSGQLELTRNHASAPYMKTFMSSGNPAIHLGDSSGDRTVIHGHGNSYFKGGYLGVGTDNPLSIIHATESIDGTGYRFINTHATSGFGVFIKGGGTTADRYALRVDNAAGDEIFRVSANQRVGIGSEIPSELLDIGGNTTVASNGRVNIYRPTSGSTNTAFQINSDVGGTDTTQFIIQAGGYVGIGEDSPDTNLHVKGTGTDILKIESTDAGAQGTNLILQHSPGAGNMADNDVISLIQFAGKDDSNNTTTYSSIRAVATDVSNNSEKGDLTFFTRNGGTFGEKLRIASNGKVGMGLTSTSGGKCDPDGNHLLIRGASTFQTTKGHIMLTGDGATNGEGPQIVFSESGSGSNFAGAYIGHERKGSNSLGDLVFGTRETGGDANTVPEERLRIASSGNVSIGTQNVTQGVLQINGDVTAGYHHGGGMYGMLAKRKFQGGDALGGYAIRYASGYESPWIVGYNAGNSYDNQITFGSMTTSDRSLETGVQKRMVIDMASGNVGIGENDPDRELHISNGTTGGIIRLTNTDTTIADNTICGMIEFEQRDSNTPGVSANIRAEMRDTTNGANSLKFSTGTPSTIGTRMTIRSDGNVGIAEENPSYKLQVNGTTYIDNHALIVEKYTMRGTGNWRATNHHISKFQTSFTNGGWFDVFKFTKDSNLQNNNYIGVYGGVVHIVYINERSNSVQTSGYCQFPFVIRGRSNNNVSGTVGSAIAHVSDVIGSAVDVRFNTVDSVRIDMQVYIYNSDGAQGENQAHIWIDGGGAATQNNRAFTPAVI